MQSKYSYTLVVFCLAAAVPATAAAQDVKQSDLELCASQETTELKLACFDALAAVNKSTAASAGAAVGSADKSNQPATDTRGVPDTAAEAAQNSGATAPAAVPGAAGAAAVNVAADAPSTDPADDLGREHLARDQDDDKQSEEAVTVTVVDVTQGRYKVLYFTFANGQRWRQIEGRRFRYPKEGDFDAIITKGMLGDYRMRLDENSPMTRIRRIE